MLSTEILYVIEQTSLFRKCVSTVVQMCVTINNVGCSYSLLNNPGPSSACSAREATITKTDEIGIDERELEKLVAKYEVSRTELDKITD